MQLDAQADEYEQRMDEQAAQYERRVSAVEVLVEQQGRSTERELQVRAAKRGWGANSGNGRGAACC